MASNKPELTVLGQTVRNPIDHVEVFPAPQHVTKVRFTTDELCSVCPVTQQPDVANVVIEYVPNQWCIASKSLKLYLWRFRDMPVFAEALVKVSGAGRRPARPTRPSRLLPTGQVRPVRSRHEQRTNTQTDQPTLPREFVQ